MGTKLDMTTFYSPSPEAIESRLGEETVILHLGNGTYFGLDPVGTFVWEWLSKATHATPEEICAHVRASFDAPAETVDRDVTAFLTQLAAHGLILQG